MTTRTERYARALTPQFYDHPDAPGHAAARTDVETTVAAVLALVDAERTDRDETIRLVVAMLEDADMMQAARRVDAMLARTPTGAPRIDPPTGTLTAVPDPQPHRRDITAAHMLRGNRP